MSHEHSYVLKNIKHYFNHDKGCMIKDVLFKCVLCGRKYHEKYEYRPPPKKHNSRVLQKNKRK